MKFQAPALALLAATLLLLGVPAMGGSASAEDEQPESRVWKRLKMSDANGDGKVTREEFRGPDRMWDRLDGDGDGVITRKEADAASNRRGGRGTRGEGRGGGGEGRGRPGGFPRGLSFERLDVNKDGKVSDEEWATFRKAADTDKDGTLSKQEWDAALGGASSRDSAPAVGAPAPKGSAQIRGLTATIDLTAPKRTTVLIFGSWTWGPFSRVAEQLEKAYQTYKSKADFYLIYIKEAHPQDGRRPSDRVKIDQPKTFERRDEVAGKCVADLKLTMPVLVDDMQNTLATAYNAMPDRLFIVGADGKIAFRGDKGPRGFSVDAMESALKKLLLKSTPEKAK